jgi:hypothetical protein
MSNYLDEEEEPFSDQPDEIVEGEQDPAVSLKLNRPTANLPKPAPASAPVEEEVEEEVEEIAEEVENENFAEVFSDANLRIEQGRLYQMVMNNSLFEGLDADPKAIQNVEKEIRKFARERMEIMLGMRQEAPKETAMSMEGFPFNALEVEVLKSLASVATKGASLEAAPFSGAVAKKKTLTPINANRTPHKPAPAVKPVVKSTKPLNTKPAKPMVRKVDAAIQRILDEEGVTLDQVNEVFDPNHKVLSKSTDELTEEEIVERNKQANGRVGKQVASRNAIPMPSEDQMAGIYQQRAEQANANPQMKMIMGYLNNKK